MAFCARAAALFTLIASCRLHRIDLERYLDEILGSCACCRIGLRLATSSSLRSSGLLTRAKLAPQELEAPLGPITWRSVYITNSWRLTHFAFNQSSLLPGRYG
jgi:hypothetical protein